MANRLWNRHYISLIAIDATMQFGMYLTRPIVSGFALALGATLAIAGLLAGMNATMAMIMRPATGALADLISKKRLLVGSCALFVASAIGCSLSTSPAILGIFCAVQGVAFAFRSCIMVPLVSLVVPEEQLASGVGWLGASYTLAGAAGPAIGGFVGGIFGYPAAFALSGGLFTIGLTLAALFKEPAGASGHARTTTGAFSAPTAGKTPSSHPRPSIRSFIYLPALPLSIIACLLMVAQGTMNSFILLLGDAGEVAGAPLYFVAYSIVVLGTRPIAGNICDRHGLAVVAIPCMLLASCAMMLLVFWRGPVAIVTAAILMGAGQAPAYSAMQAEAVRGVGTAHLGRASNTFYIGPDLGMGFGPIASGYVWQTFGVQALFVFCSFCIMVACVLFVFERISARHKAMTESPHER